jgi:allantoin racemase
MITRLLTVLSIVGPLLGGGAAMADETGKVIVLINPNSNAAVTHTMAELARAEIGTVATVNEMSNSGVPPLLTTPEDMANAIPGVVAAGVEAAKNPQVSAIIVAAFGDPGLAELRETVGVPVFGIGEEAFREAAEGGRPFGIATITPNPELVASFKARAEALGFGAQYRGVRVTPGDPKEIVKDPAKLDAALAEAVRESIEKDGAQAVIMGGGPLSGPGNPLTVAIRRTAGGCGQCRCSSSPESIGVEIASSGSA